MHRMRLETGRMPGRLPTASRFSSMGPMLDLPPHLAVPEEVRKLELGVGAGQVPPSDAIRQIREITKRAGATSRKAEYLVRLNRIAQEISQSVGTGR